MSLLDTQPSFSNRSIHWLSMSIDSKEPSDFRVTFVLCKSDVLH